MPEESGSRLNARQPKANTVPNQELATEPHHQAPPQQKIMITGDDILIEYVTRLMHLFTSNRIKEEILSKDQTAKIEKFITHYVWYA